MQARAIQVLTKRPPIQTQIALWNYRNAVSFLGTLLSSWHHWVSFVPARKRTSLNHGLSRHPTDHIYDENSRWINDENRNVPENHIMRQNGMYFMFWSIQEDILLWRLFVVIFGTINMIQHSKSMIDICKMIELHAVFVWKRPQIWFCFTRSIGDR